MSNAAMTRGLAGVTAAGMLLLGCAAGSDASADSMIDESRSSGRVPQDTSTPESPSEPSPERDDDPEPEPEPEDARPRSPLTGEHIDEDVLDAPLLLVKVPNTPPARPQSGLDAADVVYEEVVEGGATRFFAVFHSDFPDVVGPIRSARPVDAELLRGYGASAFAYSGARAEVQGMLASTPSIRLTEGHPGFFRDPSRPVPWEYTLYVDPSAVRDAAVERGAQAFTEVSWSFDEALPGDALRCPGDAVGCDDPGVAIEIAMSRSYVTGWTYDASEGVYRRSQNGAATTVTGEGRIGASNVVVLDTHHYTGESGYPETSVVTDGAPAIVLRDGERFAARWTKPSMGSPLKVLTTDGEPFPLRPGATWVHLASDVPVVGE